MNVETPGTLGELITAAGKNPDKIRNLKVTGNVNADDFYFMRDNMAILEAVNMKEASLESIDFKIPVNAFYNKKSLVKFVFPESVSIIESSAFSGTLLAGTLILPNNVIEIKAGAFALTMIGSVLFPEGLTYIGYEALRECKNLSGSLNLPNSVEYIGERAFYSCSLSGYLHLPDNLETIVNYAFSSAGAFQGDLIIPEKITRLEQSTFAGTTFTGSLILNNVQEIGERCFSGCHFSGELIVPEGIIELPLASFSNNDFSSVRLPSSLRNIGSSAFSSNYSIMTHMEIPEGVVSIGTSSFLACRNIKSLRLPSTLQSIGTSAFQNCFYISSIISAAIEPPIIQSGAFDGVAKDNFTLEVPAQSVKRYQTESGWSDFKRIAAHYDFSVSRSLMRALNGSISESTLKSLDTVRRR